MPDNDLPIDPDLAPGGRRAQPSVLVAIASGGALGASARYGVSRLMHVAPDSFPWPTFWTNLTGSFALGLVLVLVLAVYPASRFLRPFVATGFIGAYTTYSTFAVETDLLIKDGHTTIALTYAGASLVAGLGAVWAGICVGRAATIPGATGRRSG